MNKRSLLNIFLSGTLLISGCTKLDEKVLDEALTAGLTEKQTAEGVTTAAYALLPSIFLHTNYFNMQEISTDEAILPYRGGTDWGDNGIYISMHTHNYASTDPNIKNTFNFIAQSLSRTVTAIATLKTNTDPSAKTFLAESYALQAYYNMLMLDLFGIIFVKETPQDISTILRGNDAVEYIKNEFLLAEPNLETTVGQGRMTKAAVWGLLARLHLNAAAYRNIQGATLDFKGDDMDKVIEYTTKVIGSNQYALASEYFSIFNDDNNTNKEIIYSIDQRADLNGHNRLAYFSLSGDQYPLPNYTAANGTDGPAITPDFYKTWVDAYAPADPSVDPRFYKQNLSVYSNANDTCVPAAEFNINRGILRGQQYGLVKQSDGTFQKCSNGSMKVVKLYHFTRSKPTLPVLFTEKVDYTTEGSNYPSGYRVEKYEFSRGSVSGRNFGEVNIVILRLADIYHMRAEAKLRKSNDAAGALADINLVRASRTARQPQPPALTTMNLDILYRERGFEFYWELLRRTDMIRFGKYEGTWTEKTNTDVRKRLFPIPQSTIDGASNIPNYLIQNPGY